ncbi:MAG: hypothetical protein WCD18_07875, partial [Thermosynechococcaceae cyanobacterium]
MNRSTLLILGKILALSGLFLLLESRAAAQVGTLPQGVLTTRMDGPDDTELLLGLPRSAEDYYNQGLAFQGRGQLDQAIA